MTCTREEHERMKRDDARWITLELRGVQEFDDGGPAMELRNCPHCDSTLGRDAKETR